MAPYRRKTSVNATELLTWRIQGIGDVGTINRHNMKVFRNLLCQVMKKKKVILIEFKWLYGVLKLR